MLSFKNISKSYSGVEVLHNVSFDAEQGKILAVVGENGAGKSTLMKVLSGIITDYTGYVSINGKQLKFKNPRDAQRQGVSMIHQELNLFPHLTIGENIFTGNEPLKALGRIDFKILFEESDKLLRDFDFPYSSKIKIQNIGIGWQQMVEIARTLRLNTNSIIMDEPTSALSQSEIDLLFEKIHHLKSLNKTIFFISHRLKEVLDIADEIVVLRDGFFEGKYPVKDISREQLIALMIGRQISPDKSSRVLFSEKVYLKVDHLEVFNKKISILRDINYSIKRGEILGIAGLLGAGRTELLKFLYGELYYDYRGKIELEETLYRPNSALKAIEKGIVYLPDDRKTEGIFPDLGLLFNSSISKLPWLSRLGFIKTDLEKQLVSGKFGDLKVRKKSLNQKIPTLSGGNQQKVLLSRVLLLNPKLLLLDEPTRGIDVGAKEEIYRLIARLSNQGVAIMVTSSEISELLRICHRILVLSHGCQTALLETSRTNSQEILSSAFEKV